MAARKTARPRKAPMPGGGRRAVLVLGPPRSGTSAVAHMLSNLGVYFGEETDFVDPTIHTHNPVFFELQRLNEVNERVLREIGYEYEDFDFFPGPQDAWDVFSEALLCDAGRLLRSQLGDRSLVGLKDPRFCLTLPFWKRILAEHGYSPIYVVTHRSSEAIRNSNTVVHGVNRPAYTTRLQKLSAGAAFMHLEQERIELVDYDALVQCPAKTAARLAKILGVGNDRVAEAASAIDADLRHQTTPQVERTDPGADFVRAGSEYRSFRDKLNDWGVLELMNARRSEISRLQLELKNNAARVNELTGFIDSLSLNKNNELVDRLQAAINPLQVQVDYFGQLLKKQISATLRAERQLRTEIRRLRADLADCQKESEEQISALSAEIEAARLKLHEATAKLRTRDSEVESLKSRLEEAEKSIGAYEAEAEKHNEAQKRLASEASSLRAELKEKAESCAVQVASLKEEINHAHQVNNSYKLAREKMSSEVDRLNVELQECKVDLEVSIHHRKNFERLLADLYKKMQDLEQGRGGK